jgi:hypothetical protein
MSASRGWSAGRARHAAARLARVRRRRRIVGITGRVLAAVLSAMVLLAGGWAWATWRSFEGSIVRVDALPSSVRSAHAAASAARRPAAAVTAQNILIVNQQQDQQQRAAAGPAPQCSS